MKLLPQARNSELVVQELSAEELLVYDLNTDQAYQLNKSLLIVFQACDGKTSFDELKRRHKFTDDLIHLALAELDGANLLIGYQSIHFANLSRRQAIRQTGLACAALLPVIIGITAPAAVEAASTAGGGGGFAINAICSTNTQCASRKCLGTTVQTITSDGTASTFHSSGKKHCCATTTFGNPDDPNSTYPANDQSSCGFSFSCCSGKGTVSATPNSGGYYTCTCT